MLVNAIPLLILFLQSIIDDRLVLLLLNTLNIPKHKFEFLIYVDLLPRSSTIECSPGLLGKDGDKGEIGQAGPKGPPGRKGEKGPSGNSKYFSFVMEHKYMFMFS